MQERGNGNGEDELAPTDVVAIGRNGASMGASALSDDADGSIMVEIVGSDMGKPGSTDITCMGGSTDIGPEIVSGMGMGRHDGIPIGIPVGTGRGIGTGIGTGIGIGAGMGLGIVRGAAGAAALAAGDRDGEVLTLTDGATKGNAIHATVGRIGRMTRMACSIVAFKRFRAFLRVALDRVEEAEEAAELECGISIGRFARRKDNRRQIRIQFHSTRT